ncbi:hypothetical protein D3C71_2210240 [compost metagenome]
MNGSLSKVCQSISPRSASGESDGTTATNRSMYNGVNSSDELWVGSNATPNST